MCNRYENGYRCNRRFNEEGFYNQELNGRYNDAYWREAECMFRECNRRRQHEDRCAREFVRCMRCRNWNF